MLKKTYHEINSMSENEKRDFIFLLADRLKPEFSWNGNFVNQIFPVFRHTLTNMEFVYLPSGKFEMGFSEKQEESARLIFNPVPANLEEMRPVRNVAVEAFLVSRTPVLNNVAVNYISDDKLKKDNPFFPGYLKREDAEYLAGELSCRLPSEKEWEYACRAGTKTLFTWGNEIPNKEELAKWLSWDFSSLEKLNPNFFGLYGLFTGEWCKDVFYQTYNYRDSEKTESFVVRGGGAFFWEWQDQEWVWCMSAMRMPSSDLPDNLCGLRLVFEL